MEGDKQGKIQPYVLFGRDALQKRGDTAFRWILKWRALTMIVY